LSTTDIKLPALPKEPDELRIKRIIVGGEGEERAVGWALIRTNHSRLKSAELVKERRGLRVGGGKADKGYFNGGGCRGDDRQGEEMNVQMRIDYESGGSQYRKRLHS